MNSSPPRFKRILLKLSGEALVGGQSFGIEPSVLERIAGEIKAVHEMGVEIGIVVGGGNIFRGLNSGKYGVTRVAGDHMGMLATIMNSIALAEALHQAGADTRIMTAINMNTIAEPYIRKRALRHLEKNRIVIIGAGTGNPYFTTDTAATLRAAELDAEVLLKATRVDGVYDADPETDPSAVHFDTLSYHEVMERELKVMDLTAVSLAMDRKLPIVVFNLRTPGNLARIIAGEPVGTLISGDTP